MESKEDSSQPARKGDPFVRRYLMVMGLLMLAGLTYYLSNLDQRVEEINAALAASPALAEYPYRFRVLALDGGVAVVTSPRTAEMGPMHFLRILDPALNDKDVVHPDMMAAQDLLAERQIEAERIITSEPDVDRIRWQLDERWYAEQGVFLPE